MKQNILFPIFLMICFLGSASHPAQAVSFYPKMDSIQLYFDEQQLLLPGESFRIGVISYYKNGKIKRTVGMDGGSILWWRYHIDVTGGKYFSGRILVNEELIPSKGKYIGLKISPRRQHELMKELLLPLNYETKITYRPVAAFDKAPGSQIKGELVSEFDNGIQRVCTNLRNSKESNNFQFSGEGGTWKNGKFTIEPDFTKIEQHLSSVIVNSVRNNSVADTFSVLLDYKHAYKLCFSGSSGMPGFSGSNGGSGSSGMHGGDGQNGQPGDFGNDGPELGVWVDLYRDSVLNTDLLYVYAQNLWTGEESRYLINPNGGSLDVSSNGGSGGSGGSGGNGGSGGKGQEGEKWIETHIEKQTVKKPVTKTVIRKEKQKRTDADGKEYEVEVDVEVAETIYVDEEIKVVVEVVKQGPGGDGGDGGWGGAGALGGGGGYGGNITLYFTDDARPYQYLFVARSEGGSGGMNGSGGLGGLGGSGGQGNPNGRSGLSGPSGPSAFGWAQSGGSGQIRVQSTEEFFFYQPIPKQ
jgi:hypothetical protein